MIPVPITIEPYLAEYFNSKYGGNESGPMKISDKTDLYHVLWRVMEHRPADVPPVIKGNLVFMLPERRIGKDPLYYNYIRPYGVRAIERSIRLEFNNELHSHLEQNELRGRPMELGVAIFEFLQRYEIQSISSEAIIKNYYRWRQRVRPYEKRAYHRKNQ